MDPVKYKQYHEARMVNNTGSSPYEVEAVLTTVSIGVLLRLLIHFHLLSISSHSSFLVDFLLIALPVTMEVTVFSSSSFTLPITMIVLSFGIVYSKITVKDVKKILSEQITNQKSYFTNYRGSTNLVSTLCILAVDFSAFPRKFAKTETIGFGLMDLGVGYYICSNGIVTKNLITRLEFSKTIKSTSILVLLGFIRLLSVKSTNYHEHASEYGVHWNFFFTLGFCRIVSYLILMISPIKNPSVMAVSTGFIHQMLLNSGFQEIIFSNGKRENLLSANREGLISLLGYVSLYFASVAVGQVIYKPQIKIIFRELLWKLMGMCMIGWSCTYLCDSTIGVSRRLANIGYISWIISSTITVLMEFVLIDVIITCINQKRYKSLNMSQTPVMLDSINANGLFFFLFANLMTGLINFCFQTLLLDTAFSLFIIGIYMLIICGVPYLFYSKNYVLKFW